MPIDVNPVVSVIVLNYNGLNFLKDCFDSLIAGTYEGTELYMYDNLSTDSSIEYVQKNYPQVKIIAGNENGGYSNAYNQAMKSVSGKYAVLLNNDVKVYPNWIEPLVAAAEKDPSIAALQPKLVWFSDHKRFEYAGSSGGQMDQFGFPFTRGRIFFTIENDNGQYDDEIDIFWASGAALFIRSDIYRECGGLDETFVHHMEEIDMCWRIHLLGYKIKVIPASVVAHHGGATITDDSFKKMHWNHRNSIFMLIKNLGGAKLLPNVFIHLLFDYVALFQSLASLKPRRARAIIKAHFWILFNIRMIWKKRREVQRMRKADEKAIAATLYPKSIVYQYFFKKLTTYQQLNKS